MRTITRKQEQENPFEAHVPVVAHSYENTDVLAKAMSGAQKLISTYWRRLPDKKKEYKDIISNTRNLLTAAKRVGVEHIVHCSISNPYFCREFSYFQAKCDVEEMVQECAIPSTILRPQLIFGDGELLINNLAWMLRRSPIAVIPGDGKYLLQPISARDYAALAISPGDEKIIDALGPETYAYNDMVRMIGSAIDRKPHLLHVAPKLFVSAANVMNKFFEEPTLADFEVYGCLIGNTFSQARPARGADSFAQWVKKNSDMLGKNYAVQNRRPYRT